MIAADAIVPGDLLVFKMGKWLWNNHESQPARVLYKLQRGDICLVVAVSEREVLVTHRSIGWVRVGNNDIYIQRLSDYPVVHILEHPL